MRVAKAKPLAGGVVVVIPPSPPSTTTTTFREALPRSETLTFPARSSGGRQAVAFNNLQTAILRLASKPAVRPDNTSRNELSALVEQALEAYREYMKTV